MKVSDVFVGMRVIVKDNAMRASGENIFKDGVVLGEPYTKGNGNYYVCVQFTSGKREMNVNRIDNRDTYNG
jgi:hypothetical protein